MALVVQKFGGSSLATAAKVLSAARRAVAEFEAGNQVVMVCSAQGRMTDELVARAQEISQRVEQAVHEMPPIGQ